MSDVRAFGAKGDGVADDAPAIQHAVEKVSDGLLEFPLGNYRLSRTVEIKLAQHGRDLVVGDQLPALARSQTSNPKLGNFIENRID